MEVGDDGNYDLWVLAPNGFHRQFKGNLNKVRHRHTPNPEIFVGYNLFDGGLHVQLRNDGNSHLQFTVKSNKIYGPLLAVSASISAALQPEFPGFGPLPGLQPVGLGQVPGFRLAPDPSAPGFGFSPSVFFPGPGFGGPARRGMSRCPASGHPSELYWNLRSTGHWYDFVVTCDSDDGFSRRFAGHVETGRSSVSDPGMGVADQF